MDLTMNGNSVAIKYNFASLKTWRDQFKGEGVDTDDDVYDNLFIGLVNSDPMTIVKALYGGLSHLDIKPTFDDTFEAVSDLLDKTDPDELSAQILVDISSEGFFRLAMKKWRNIFEKLQEYSKKSLESLMEPTKPAKNAKAAKLEEYTKKTEALNSAKQQLQGTLDNSIWVLNQLDKKLGVTETASQSQENERA